MKVNSSLSRNVLVTIIVSFLVFTVNASAQEILLADTIITNARIYSMDNEEILADDPGSIVEAMAIRDGKKLALGNNNDMLDLVKAGTRVIDLQAKTVIPGLIETHVHPEATMYRAGLGSPNGINHSESYKGDEE